MGIPKTLIWHAELGGLDSGFIQKIAGLPVRKPFGGKGRTANEAEGLQTGDLVVGSYIINGAALRPIDEWVDRRND